MSSYALLNAYIGLTFDQRIGEIGFKPAGGGEGIWFWSAGRGWGEIEFKGGGVTLSVKGGTLDVSRLRLAGFHGRPTIDGKAVEREGDLILLGGQRQLKAGDSLVVEGNARGQP